MPALAGQETADFSTTWYWWANLQIIAQTLNWSWDGPVFYWSLAVEEHFYLFWPLLVYYLPRKQVAIASFFLIALSFIVRIFMLNKGMEVFYFTLTRLDALSLGALLAVFEPQLLRPSQKNRRLFLFSLFLVDIPLTLIFVLAAGRGSLWVLAVKYPMTALVYTSLIGFSITTKNDSILRKVFESQALRFVGSISFGLYVYHLLCYSWLDTLVPNSQPLLMMPLAFLFSGAVSYLSFLLLEKPFLKLRRFFPYQKKVTA